VIPSKLAGSDSGSTRSDGVLFEPVTRAPRLSDKVADMILDRILTMGFRPGDKLPSERELGEQFGVSRTVIREATRALAARGIIDVRAGVGLCVAAVDASAVSSTMRLFMHGSEELTYEEVHEVRRLIEIDAAGLAAERATDDDLAKLTACMDNLAKAGDDAELWALSDVEFHRTVCALTHNPLYVIMLDSIGDVLVEIRRATVYIPRRLPKLLVVHQQIHDAIAAHDVARARRTMRSHLQELERAWSKLARPVGRIVKAT
jgi:GntR family transcriptional repressor for pyruvate dehydrogenase complex